MNVDIKTLLLKSLSSEKTISRSQRIYFRKSCFIIRYEVKGKILCITNVKRILRKNLTWRQRLKRRFKFIRLYSSNVKNYLHKVEPNSNQKVTGYEQKTEKRVLNVIKTQSLVIDKVLQQTKEVQTLECKISPTVNCKATETDNLQKTTTAQQTIASTRYNLSRLPGGQSIVPPALSKPLTLSSSKICQTEIFTVTKGIQCKRHTTEGATQTDELSVKSASTQVRKDLLVGNIEKPYQTIESTAKPSASKMTEKEVVIYMLNEIGELVLNQNHILNINTQMLGHINEMVNLGKSWRSKKGKRSHKHFQKKGFHKIISCLGTPDKIKEEKRDQSIQTERFVTPEMVTKITQTTCGSLKPRNWIFFKNKR